MGLLCLASKEDFLAYKTLKTYFFETCKIMKIWKGIFYTASVLRLIGWWSERLLQWFAQLAVKKVLSVFWRRKKWKKIGGVALAEYKILKKSFLTRLKVLFSKFLQHVFVFWNHLTLKITRQRQMPSGHCDIWQKTNLADGKYFEFFYGMKIVLVSPSTY